MSDPSFAVVTVAVLSTWPQSSASVVARTCTVVTSPRPAWTRRRRGCRPRSTSRPTPGRSPSRSRSGRTSVNCTPRAWPAPVLRSVTVNPIGSPALTLPASATLSTSMSAQSTSVVAVSLSVPLEAVTVAVFCARPQSAASVVAMTWTERRRARGQRGRREDEVLALDRPAGRGRRDRPGEAARQDVRELDVARLARTGVRERHGEADLVAGRHALVVGHLLDVDRGAVHVDRGGRGVRPVVRRGGGRRVVDLAAVLRVGRGDDVHRGDAARGERRRREDQVAARDRPAGRRRARSPSRGRRAGRR